MFIRLTFKNYASGYYNINQILCYTQITHRPEGLDGKYRTEIRLHGISESLYVEESVKDINKQIQEMKGR